jgi:SAM-dependent methyltransferase
MPIDRIALRLPSVAFAALLLMLPALASAQEAPKTDAPPADAPKQETPQQAPAKEEAKEETKAPERPRLDVIFVPTPQPAVDRMLDLARVGPGDFVIDLGSGDGRIAITAGRRGARAMGVDLDPQRIAEAMKNLEASAQGDRVRFVRQNLFETDLSKATVLTMYLLPHLNIKLRPQILNLRPGTRIASHDFTMGEWEPDIFEDVNGRDVMLWIVPAKVEGNWRVQAGRQTFDISIKQEFQEIKGTAQIGNRRVPLRRTRLAGDQIEFSAQLGRQMLHFRGRVEDNRMTGRVMGGERADRRGRRWSAQRS